jgi:hypothetical protein
MRGTHLVETASIRGHAVALSLLPDLDVLPQHTRARLAAEHR